MNPLKFLKRKVGDGISYFRKASWKKKTLIVCIVLIIIFIIIRSRSGSTSDITLEPVTRETIVDQVTESGNVASTGQFEVYSPSTGYVEDVYVKNGDNIATGQNLFKVKSTATVQEKAAASASYLQAKAAYDNAQATAFSLRSTMYTQWKKFTDLATNSTYENGDDSPNLSQRESAEFQTFQDNWKAAEASYKNQQEVIAQTQSALGSASLSYQATQDIVVTAPATGVIANFSLRNNDRITASSANAVSPNPVLVIGDFSNVLVKIPLNEVDVNKVKPGQNATLTFDAMREKKYTGHVGTVDLVGTNTAGVITYNAYISIDDKDPNIKPAMTVTVSMETGKHENVLTVPNISVKPFKGAKAVIVAGANKDTQVKDKSGKKLPYHYVPVVVGVKGTTNTEILDGVNEQMQVVTGGITL